MAVSAGVTRGREETAHKFLKRVSHLNLHRRRLATLDGIAHVPNVRTVYAYENRIRSLGASLFGLQALQVIYLENNDLTSLDGIQHAPALQKLFVTGNRIQLVGSHVAQLEQLEQLHIGQQRLPAGVPLLFEQAAIRSLASSLRVLDVSNNNLATLDDFRPLRGLSALYAGGNQLLDLAPICSLVSGLAGLQRLDLRDNPLALAGITGAGKAYRIQIIAAAAGSYSFSWLDGMPVESRYKRFAEKLAARRAARDTLGLPYGGQHGYGHGDGRGLAGDRSSIGYEDGDVDISSVSDYVNSSGGGNGYSGGRYLGATSGGKLTTRSAGATGRKAGTVSVMPRKLAPLATMQQPRHVNGPNHSALIPGGSHGGGVGHRGLTHASSVDGSIAPTAGRLQPIAQPGHHHQRVAGQPEGGTGDGSGAGAGTAVELGRPDDGTGDGGSLDAGPSIEGLGVGPDNDDEERTGSDSRVRDDGHITGAVAGDGADNGYSGGDDSLSSAILGATLQKYPSRQGHGHGVNMPHPPPTSAGGHDLSVVLETSMSPDGSPGSTMVASSTVAGGDGLASMSASAGRPPLHSRSGSRPVSQQQQHQQASQQHDNASQARVMAPVAPPAQQQRAADAGLDSDADGDDATAELQGQMLAKYRQQQAAAAAAAGSGDAGGFRSRRPVRDPRQDAATPLRTPTDFTRQSRFGNSGYASPEDRSMAEQRVAAMMVQHARAAQQQDGSGGSAHWAWWYGGSDQMSGLGPGAGLAQGSVGSIDSLGSGASSIYGHHHHVHGSQAAAAGAGAGAGRRRASVVTGTLGGDGVNMTLAPQEPIVTDATAAASGGATIRFTGSGAAGAGSVASGRNGRSRVTPLAIGRQQQHPTMAGTSLAELSMGGSMVAATRTFAEGQYTVGGSLARRILQEAAAHPEGVLVQGHRSPTQPSRHRPGGMGGSPTRYAVADRKAPAARKAKAGVDPSACANPL